MHTIAVDVRGLSSLIMHPREGRGGGGEKAERGLQKKNVVMTYVRFPQVSPYRTVGRTF